MNYDPRQLQQLMNDPQEMARKAGFSFPEELKDPKQIVQHLIMTGQVPSPVLSRILPMMQKMGR